MFEFSRKTIIASALITSFIPFENAITRSKITKYDEQKTSDVKDEYIDSYQTLSDAELLKYNALMSGYRGYVSPNLDPLSLLGIESKNDSERRHYAELWIKQEFKCTEKKLKFQREVDAAWKRLMPNMLPVNMGNAAGIAHDSGGRLALFVCEADCQRCDARLSAVLADKRPVDIYLVDSEGSDQKLQNWAQQHRISAEQVREHRITRESRRRPLDGLRQWPHASSAPAGGKRMAYRSVVTAALLLSTASSVASTNMQSVPSGYQKVALQHGIPAESLYSLALAESSRQLPHGTRP